MIAHRTFFAVGLIGFLLAAPGISAEAPSSKTLEDLISKAKASNHKITLTQEGVAPEIIRAKEAAFEKRFGFPVRLENQPGHHRDVPVKVVEAAKTGRAVVDMWDGGTPLILGMFRAGNTRPPPWAAVYQGWPLAKKLREAVPPIGGGPNGAVLSDHCMQMGMGSWSMAYNTRRVKKNDLKGIKLEDLTAEKWRNRVVWDVRALGLFALPFASGWDVERMRVFAHNLGANGAKLVSGGTTGVLQALVQGEADIGVASMTTVVQQKALGAPVDVAFGDFVMGNFTVTCLITPAVNDPNMAALYWAWDVFDGNYTEAKITSGGVFRFYEEEEKHLPLVRLAKENGIKSREQVVGPRTEEESEKASEYRKIAIKALKEGVTSKKKISR